MDWVSAIIAVGAGYLLGSVPVGWIVVWIATKRDLRNEHSGRTGGTNAMRVAGFGAGLVTALGDFFKAAGAVWLARSLTGGNGWVEASAGFLAVFGHNHSMFLIEQFRKTIRFRGGAGGGATVGVATAMWPPAALIIIPLGLLILLAFGYASVSTMMVGIIAIIIFVIRAVNEQGPWAYVAFAIGAEALLLWGLRPNIDRLKQGTERLIGWRARQKERLKRSLEGEDTTAAQEVQ
jgi:glycerol-3-phosphate acyltransferase PlsY